MFCAYDSYDKHPLFAYKTLTDQLSNGGVLCSLRDTNPLYVRVYNVY